MRCFIHTPSPAVCPDWKSLGNDTAMRISDNIGNPSSCLGLLKYKLIACQTIQTDDEEELIVEENAHVWHLLHMLMCWRHPPLALHICVQGADEH